LTLISQSEEYQEVQRYPLGSTKNLDMVTLKNVITS
jgi:hypothetical protein